MHFVPTGNNTVPNLQYISKVQLLNNVAAGHQNMLPSLAGSESQYQIWGVFLAIGFVVNNGLAAVNGALIISENLGPTPLIAIPYAADAGNSSEWVTFSQFIPIPGFITQSSIDFSWAATAGNWVGNAYATVYFSTL